MKTNLTNIYYRFVRSEQIIHHHLLSDYPIFTLIYHQILLLQIFNVLSLATQPNYVAFSYINLLYCFSLICRGLLHYYIMFFHNTFTSELVLQGIRGGVFLIGGATAFHTSQSVYFIPPNKLSNFYNTCSWSPLGRGYGAHSCSQLIAADILRGQLGAAFNPAMITDENLIISPSKLAHKYAEVRRESLKEFGEHVMPKYSDIVNSPKSK